MDATADILDDPAVKLLWTAGMAEKEAALIVRREAGVTLVVNGILANVRRPKGIGAQIMASLLGFGVARPMVPWLGRWLFVKDKAAFAAALRAWAADPKLKRIVVSHGDVIAEEPRAALERAARDVAG